MNQVDHPGADSFEDFFENAAVPMHQVGGDGTILRANAAELQMLEYEAADYLGHNIAEFHVDRPAVDDILARLSSGRNVEKYPARLRTKSGAIKHVLISSNALVRDGVFINSRCVTIDVTESRATEDKLAVSERNARQLLEALPVAIYTTDAEGRITFFNQAAADFAGTQPEIGTDKWCVTWRLYWPDGRPLPHDECPMAVALKEGRIVRNVEAIAERPDGSRVHFLPFPTPLFDESGKIIGGVNLLMDITERTSAETATARLAAIVESSDDAIISKTLDGTIVSWNRGATRIFGYEAEEMIGQPIVRLIPAALRQEEERILAQLARGEHIQHFETKRVAKNGRQLDISLSVSPVRDKSGRITGAAKVARDITERKRADRQQMLLLQELNHRVKNTLATVQAIANQSLLHAKRPGDFAASFSGRIQALARAHALLTDRTFEGAEIGALVRDQVMLGDGRDDARVTFSGPVITLNAQITAQLALVLHELGTNARKYGALSVGGGRLSISWELQTNGRRHLAINWKEGRGPKVIAPATAGFGTTLLQQTVQALGGEISMRYEATGMTCVIGLPLADDEEPEMKSALPNSRAAGLRLVARSEPSNLKGTRVLVVEDEPLLSMDVESALENVGCIIVGPAASLDVAKRLVADAEADVALLDANLAGRSVGELAAGLKQRNIPFAFVTGYGREALPEGFREAPMLCKPVSHEQLIGMVCSLQEMGAAAPVRRTT